MEELVSELEAFEVDLNEYYDDAGPQSVYDTVLTGKLGALAHFAPPWAGPIYRGS